MYCVRHGDVKKLSDAFTRLFNDPHVKVLSVFVDTLADVVASHSADLSDWLPVLLPRLLNKSGSDAVVSVHSKMQRTLNVIRSGDRT